MPLALVSFAPSFRTYTYITLAVYVLYIALSSYYQDFSNFTEFIQHQYEHFWTDIFLLNLLGCVVVQLGAIFIRVMFGQLRAIEEQNIRDKINHFGLYKFVFLFGVLNLGEVGLMTKWGVWCGVLAGISLLDTLTQDRAQYLSLSPSTRLQHHLPGVILSTLLHLSTVLLFIGVLYTRGEDWHITFFLLADVFLFYLKTLHSIFNYGLIIYEMYTERWENKDVTRYYTEISFDVMMLSVELLHNIHMLLYSGVLLSMGSFVLCMHIKHIYNEIRKRWIRHKNFRSIMDSLDLQFRVATSEELEANNDHCAICWEEMNTARKLPCGHLFHISCLRSWLEHDTSCPTCRHVLLAQRAQQEEDAPTARRNMAWQFRGSRWASWLPNFSVHVIRSPQHIDLDSRMVCKVDQVQEVLPHIPRSVIEQDLRRTGNPLATIDNLLQSVQTVHTPENAPLPENSPPTAVTEEPFNLPPSLQFTGSVTASVSSSNLAALHLENTDSEDDVTVRRRRVLQAVERRLEFPGAPGSS
ncbi:hypothetical protein ACHWQZ_G016183 [Mnemiopsis leidyi]